MPSSFIKFTRTLGADEVVTVNASGSSIRCTAGDAVFYVEPDGANKIELQLGLGLTFSEAAQGWIITNGPTAQTVEIYIGDGQIFDNRLVGSVSLSGGIKTAGNTGSSYGTVTCAVTATLLKAANTSRSNILIQNTDSAADLYVGNDSSVTTSNGIKVAAGGSMVLTVDDDVYGISSSGNIDIRYLEETV